MLKHSTKWWTPIENKTRTSLGNLVKDVNYRPRKYMKLFAVSLVNRGLKIKQYVILPVKLVNIF